MRRTGGILTDAANHLTIRVFQNSRSPTRAIVTILPNNPGGAVYSEEALRTVNTVRREHGIYHISNEAYEYFTYGAFEPGTAAAGARGLVHGVRQITGA